MDLCKTMVRTRVKGNGSKAASSPATEPNFYTMEPCHERPDDGNREEMTHMILDIPDLCEKEPLSCEMLDDEGIVITPHGPSTISSSNSVDKTTEEQSTDDLLVLPSEVVSHSFIVEDDSRGRSTSFDSMETPYVSASTSGLPIVSPTESRPVFSIPHPDVNRMLTTLSIPTDMPAFLPEVHSGDQIFFEGLPFHYLETKDIEDSLLQVEDS